MMVLCLVVELPIADAKVKATVAWNSRKGKVGLTFGRLSDLQKKVLRCSSEKIKTRRIKYKSYSPLNGGLFYMVNSMSLIKENPLKFILIFLSLSFMVRGYSLAGLPIYLIVLSMMFFS